MSFGTFIKLVFQITKRARVCSERYKNGTVSRHRWISFWTTWHILMPSVSHSKSSSHGDGWNHNTGWRRTSLSLTLIVGFLMHVDSIIYQEFLRSWTVTFRYRTKCSIKDIACVISSTVIEGGPKYCICSSTSSSEGYGPFVIRSRFVTFWTES